MLYVKKKDYKEPYSRLKITESMTSAGLSRHKAYKMAIDIQSELEDRSVKSVKKSELKDIVQEKLRKIDSKTSEKYIVWSHIRHERIPMIILIGGTSGIGKSSIALEIAHRLGIKQVIGTDTIREIMKNMIAPNLMPSIHYSSYEAWRSITHSVKEDKVIVGFREQARAVSTGINAVIERSLREGISLIIEGVHIVPEFIPQDPNVITVLLYLDDINVHRSRFQSRAMETHVKRDAQQYLDSIGNINIIQQYLKDTANEAEISAIENKRFNKTISRIIDIVTDSMKEILDKSDTKPL